MHFITLQCKQKGHTCRQAGFAPIFILIGVLIIGMVAGGAYYFSRSTTSKPPPPVSQTPQPTPDVSREPSGSAETVYTESDRSANWKTYENDTYKYYLKVPNNWVIDLNNARENNDRLVFIYSDDFKLVGDTQVPHLSKGSQLEILAGIVARSYDDFVTAQRPDKREYPNDGKEMMIDGEKAILWSSSNAYSIPEQKGYQLNTFHKGKGYTILMVSTLPQDLLFDQILATFKFTDQTSSEGKQCGGFVGEKGEFACPAGYKCKYPEPMYPDAQGTCVKLK